MKLLLLIFALLSAALYYFTKLDPFSQPELTLWLIELQTSIGIPLWGCAAGFALIVLLISLIQSDKSAPVAKRTATSTKLLTPKKIVFDDDLERLVLPESASIRREPQAGVAFALQLRRSTPDVARRAIEALAAYLDRTQPPERVQIHFIDVIERGVPRKAMVKGALQKYLIRDSFTIVSITEGVEIRF